MIAENAIAPGNQTAVDGVTGDRQHACSDASHLWQNAGLQPSVSSVKTVWYECK